MTSKPILRALDGQTLPRPPVWMMRQAGRYLPEYRATRAKAGTFLDLCYTPELAAEVTLQPIRRYGFDAAILFADILLVPHALGAELTFSTGEGPLLSRIGNAADLARLGRAADIHQTLSPVYETVRRVAAALPPETALIGFAGAPWTVASYMIAGRGTPDQAPARSLLYRDPATFFALLDLIADATAEYLIAQADAGAEVVKLFDSWASTVPGTEFDAVCVQPVRRILSRFRAVHPNVPVIGFPRGCGANYARYVAATAVQGIAIDSGVDPLWAALELQPSACVQGNLDPMLLVSGGEALLRQTCQIRDALAGGPHIFNLGHGITPDADPANVEIMLKALRK